MLESWFGCVSFCVFHCYVSRKEQTMRSVPNKERVQKGKKAGERPKRSIVQMVVEKTKEVFFSVSRLPFQHPLSTFPPLLHHTPSRPVPRPVWTQDAPILPNLLLFTCHLPHSDENHHIRVSCALFPDPPNPKTPSFPQSCSFVRVRVRGKGGDGRACVHGQTLQMVAVPCTRE